MELLIEQGAVVEGSHMLKLVRVVPNPSYVILIVVRLLELLFDVYGRLIELPGKIHIGLWLIPTLILASS